ncbi:MAG TPA: Clp protease N-terminal domain-containing protein [Roseiflexaceae bacterium]|nr:Clp protease N-terminal domain-containing protein [Roseiflexaceae bacterium]
MEPLEPLLTTDEVAAYLKVDVVTVRRLVTRGELAAYRVGGEYRFARADLLDYLSRQHVPARAAATGPRRLKQLVGGLVQALHGAGDEGTPPLSARARRCLQMAADEARAGARSAVGTEHLLVGLLREGEGVAAQVLGEIGITLEAVRAAIAAGTDWPERAAPAPASPGQTPLTDHAQQAVRAAVAQASEWEHSYLGTEHLLFGLTKVLDSNVALLLEQLGTTPDTVQAEVLRVVQLGGTGR